MPAALSGGVTTLITAGFEEPPWAMARTLAGIADWPLNVGLQACARAEDDGSLEALLAAGACGFKIHEDYGAYPELIDHVLRFADAARRRRLAPHRRPAREAPSSRTRSRPSPGGRSTPTTSRGAAAGTCPDVIGLVREANIICSSTTPTDPVRASTRPPSRSR